MPRHNVTRLDSLPGLFVLDGGMTDEFRRRAFLPGEVPLLPRAIELSARAKFALKQSEQPSRSPYYSEDVFTEAKERWLWGEAVAEKAVVEAADKEAAAERKRFKAKQILAKARENLKVASAERQ